MEAAAEKSWVTAEELGRACALSPKTIYQYAQHVPGFPCIRLGARNLRFDVAEVQAWLRENPDALARSSRLRSIGRAKRDK